MIGKKIKAKWLENLFCTEVLIKIYVLNLTAKSFGCKTEFTTININALHSTNVTDRGKIKFKNRMSQWIEGVSKFNPIISKPFYQSVKL